MELLKVHEFDQTILEKSLKVMEIQDIILNSNNENYYSNAITIAQKLNDKEITPLDYSYCIYTIERYDSLRANIYSKLTSEIGHLLTIRHKNQSILQELKKEILERIFLPINYQSTPHILLYFLEQNGFYQDKEFLNRIIQIKRQIPYKIEFILPFIVWFLPSLEKYDPDFYSEILFQMQSKDDEEEENDEKDEFFTFYVNDGKKHHIDLDDNNFNLNLNNKINFNDFDTIYENILDQKFYNPIDVSISNYETWFFRPKILSQFKKNNWKLHSFLCNHGYFPGSIEEAIVNDDLDKFLEFFKNSTISYETKINYNIFSHAHILNKNTNLIEFSALYSSLKIFKYLINSIESNRIKKLTDNSVNVCFLATYGGCYEILKICEQFNIDINVSFCCSACFYRHEILSWFVEEKNYDVNSYLENYLCPLHQAASSNNLRGLFYILWKGGEINKTQNDFGQRIISPCTFGIDFCGYHTTSLLLSSQKVSFDSNPNQIIEITAIYSDFNVFLDVLKFFKNSNKGEIEIDLRGNITTDIKTFDYIYDLKSKNYNSDDAYYDFQNLISDDNFLFASVIFKKFRALFNNRMIESVLNIALNIRNVEAVKILINDDQIMNSKKDLFNLLLKAILLKRLDVVKLLLLKFKVNEFILSELFNVFKINEINEFVKNSTSLFFKVFKYEKKEFFFLFFFNFAVFLFFIFLYKSSMNLIKMKI